MSKILVAAALFVLLGLLILTNIDDPGSGGIAVLCMIMALILIVMDVAAERR